MIIGLLTVMLHIPESSSLKDKRRVLKSLKDRLRNRFNVSVSEVDQNDKWQVATIAACLVTTDKAHADSSLSAILNFIDESGEFNITDHRTEIF